MTSFSKAKINAGLLAFFMFIPSLTIPIKMFLQNGVIVWLLNLILLVFSIYKNGINKKFFGVFLSLNLLFLLNILVVTHKNEVLSIYMEFLKISTIALILTLKEIDYGKFYRVWYILGVANVFVWTFYINQLISSDIGYMFFGTSMTYSFSIILYRFLDKKNILDLLLLILTFVFVAVFANRGAILACSILIPVLLYLKVKKHRILLIFSTIPLTFFYLISDIKLNLINFIMYINNILLDNDIKSYALIKLSNMFIHGLVESSSGRDGIFHQSFELIKDGFLPRGVGYFQYVTGLVYPHNLLLDIFIVFGILGIPLIVLITIHIIKFFKIERNFRKKDIVIILLIMSLTRLSLSSTFLYDTTFWVLVGVVLSTNVYKIRG
ncbi:hypothetical protein BEP19_12860 [Ammoniphilus oxalaticus]|uniref:Polysaccharide polymerase n=1 Tax=Ammoniphilus oxalaticus TaxID=66863 RepID=A0A419SH47_9BACL|nr:hypothetical protein [Ammoniphilus oxalaticus]RKD23109.1 hypothetical protein BEP19_12860 [Ammoniphilus oxalaticus]